MLTTARLVTVLGVGGLGKTRLAYEIAAASDEEAVIIISLAAVRDDADVEPAIAAALGISEASPGTGLSEAMTRPDLRARVLGVLGERPTLLVLDNCEQVVEGVASWTADLLAAVGQLRILATSRTPLAIGAEQVYPLQSLGAEDGDAAPAVRLFIERAQAVRPGAVLDLETVARLCAHLDGLPLAIELAAARVRTMTPEQIEARLQNRFALLTTGERTAPARHRTLEAVIAWSWDLLDAEARLAMSTLSVLPAGFSAQTAADMLGAEQVDDIIDRLVVQSLLMVVEGDADIGIRFRMLETVREFGLTRLAEDGGEDVAWEAALRWARSFSGAPGSAMVGRLAPLDAVLFARIRAEHDNLVVVLRRALEVQRHLDVVVVAGVLAQSWLVRGAFTELAGFAGGILDGIRSMPDEATAPDELAQVLLPFGMLSLVTGDHIRALRALARLRRLRHRSGDRMSVHWRAICDLLEVGRLSAGLATSTAALAVIERLRASSDPDEQLIGEFVLTQLSENEGETAVALTAARRSWELAEQRGDRWFAAMAASSAAELASQSGKPSETLGWLDRARDGYQAFGAREALRQQSWTRGVALLQMDRVDEAEVLFDTMVHGGERTQEGLEQASLGWLGAAEVGRLRGDGATATAAYRHALSLFRDRDQRASPWFLVTIAAVISAIVLDDPSIEEDPKHWAARLRGRFLAAQRLRPQLVDKPILGTVLIGWSAWALTDPTVRSRGLEALALAESLGARQVLPSLRIADHLAHAETIVGADAVSSARTAVSALSVAERTARAFVVLGRPQS